MTRPLLVIGNKNYSTWSLRPWLALRKAGVEFEERRLPLDTPEFFEEITDLSPTRRVPVLWHRSRCIWDSLAICEYVNEEFAAGVLLPEDRASRAWARSVCCEMHSGFNALRSALPMNLRASGRRVDLDHSVQEDINRIASLWTECREAHAARGPWLFGHFSLADAMFIPVALRFPTYCIELPELAQQYQATCLADADVQDWVGAGCAESEVVEADEAG
jgi:glutathione S-transferase